MNSKELKDFQSMVMGNHWNESLIDKAYLYAESIEDKVNLRALRAGFYTFQMRMALQGFINRIGAKSGNR
jgi:hypothetical protein